MTTFTVTGRTWATMNGPHGNPYAHAGLMAEWKALAFAAIRAANLSPVAEPVEIVATVRRVRNGRSDAHNVTPTIKACIDAVVSAGVLTDDCDDVVHALTIRRGPKAKVPTVELEIRSAATAVAS